MAILAKLQTERLLEQHLHRDDEHNKRDVDRKDTRGDEPESSALAVGLA